MRDIPDELVARIESGAATLCHVWRLTRADGVVTGFTDHDRDLTVDGLTCRAASGWTAGAEEASVGLAAGSMTAAGVLDDAVLSEADIAAGLYDQASVELWRVDWSQPELRVRLWAGRLARIQREAFSSRYRPSGCLSAGRFTAELEGPLAQLERVVGRTYGRMCDARLGDGRCGVNRALFPGVACDKRWETCVGTFGNGANFRGFPDVPGDDFLTAYPAAGGRNDGGSRR